MTIRQKHMFNYNGTDSRDLGIVNVNVDQVLLEEPFMPSTVIHEVSTKGRTKPYFMRVERQPLILNLSFAFLQQWNDPLIRQLVQLFHVDYYKPLWFGTTSSATDDDLDAIYYCMYNGDFNILHDGARRGYISMEMRCNDICAYSRLRDVNPASPYTFVNDGDIAIYPELVATSSGGTMTVNNTTNSTTLSITGLSASEVVTIDNENEIITSSLASTYRYNNHNGVFLRMEPGNNSLTWTGLSNLVIRWRYKLLQGIGADNHPVGS